MENQLLDELGQVNHMVDLDRVFSTLRTSWVEQWMTLPKVLDDCQHVLFDTHTPLSSASQSMISAAKLVCETIERSSQSSFEPAYHNRLHFADAMVSLTTLMRLQAQTTHLSSPDWMACLLLTVSAHDFTHPGGANAHHRQIEHQTLISLQALLESRVDMKWLSIVMELILRTDPADVPGNHQKVAGQAFQWNTDWTCVLLNEADILASASSLHGPGLSAALADEWKRAQHPLHAVVATPAGRVHFLKSIQFSSTASQILGIEQMVQAQCQSQ